MARSAVLAIRIISDATKAAKGFEVAETRAQKFERGLAKANKAALLVGGAGVLLGRKLEAAGEAASTSNARIEQVLGNMGYLGEEHAKVTDRAIKNAERMARATGIDPNAIKQAQSTLATFQALAKTADEVGGSFDRATAVSADLSAAGFGTAQSAAVMLGKALEDPIRGAASLREVGITLTAQQEEQVRKFQEAGKAAEAQNIILEAVEKQVGGVAEATANASDKQAVASQLMQESLGQKLAPLFERVRGVALQLADAVANNQGKALALAGVLAGLVAAVFVVNAAFKVYRATMLVVAAVKTLLRARTIAVTVAQYAMGTAWLAGRVAALAMAAGMRVLNAAMRANPLGLIITAVTVVAGLFVLAYRRSETFRSIVQRVGRAAGAAFRAATAPIRTMINVVSSLIGWISRIRFPSPPAWLGKIGSGIGSLFGGGGAPAALAAARAGASSATGRGGPGMAGGLTLSAGGAGAGGGNVIINVSGALDPVAVADQLDRLLRRRGLRTGRATG